MSKATVKQSFLNMIQIIKKSKGALFYAFMLVLIPVLIINCYSFYVVYGGTGLNYSVLDGIDFNGLILGNAEAMTKYQEAILSIFPDVIYEQNFGDIALDLINTFLIILLDAFIILASMCIVFEKEISKVDAVKQGLKKLPFLLLLSMMATWIIYEVQSMVYSSVIMFFSSVYMNNSIMIYSSVISALILIALAMLLATWVLLFVRYTAIAAVSGRCRFFVAFAYAKEILRKKVWRNMFKIMLFVLGGLIIPAILQAIAIAFGNNIPLSLSLIVVSTVLELSMFWLMWIFTVPEFFNLEKQSNIQQKIQDVIMKAMSMRNNEKNEDTNNEDEKKE